MSSVHFKIYAPAADIIHSPRELPQGMNVRMECRSVNNVSMTKCISVLELQRRETCKNHGDVYVRAMMGARPTRQQSREQAQRQELER